MTTDLEQRLREALHEDAQRAELVSPDVPPAPQGRSLSHVDHPQRSVRKHIAIAAVVALIAGAGIAVIQNDDRATDMSTHAGDLGDRAIADGAVLTPDDMPVGWEAAPPEGEEQRQVEEDELDQAFAECLGERGSEVQSDRPTAASAMVNSYEENDERVVSKVTVYESSGEAQGALDRFRDEPGQSCYLSVIEKQIAERAREGLATESGRDLSVEDIEIGESTITALQWMRQLPEYEVLGDESVAFRLKVPLSSEGVEVDVYAEVALVRKGRVAVQTLFQTYFSTFDGYAASELASRSAVLVTKKVVDRIPADASRTGEPPGESVPPAVEPLPLPEPGEPPADPVAAEEQIRAAFVGLFDGSRPREERAQFVDVPEVWIPANTALVQAYGYMLRDQHSEVEAVVFTSPTHAAVRFQVASSELPPMVEVGDAVLVDGRWLVAIATPCSMIARGNVQCDMTP